MQMASATQRSSRTWFPHARKTASAVARQGDRTPTVDVGVGEDPEVAVGVGEGRDVPIGVEVGTLLPPLLSLLHPAEESHRAARITMATGDEGSTFLMSRIL